MRVVIRATGCHFSEDTTLYYDTLPVQRTRTANRPNIEHFTVTVGYLNDSLYYDEMSADDSVASNNTRKSLDAVKVQSSDQFA